MKVCIAPSKVLSHPTMGGHAWVYSNWTLGLKAKGCDVVWIERFHPDVAASEAQRQLHHLRNCLDAIEIEAPIALILTDDQRDRFRELKADFQELTVPLTDVTAETDVLFDFYYELEPELLARFRKTVLVDIDPGLLQHWMIQQQLKVAGHDWYFTIGETVGKPDSPIPDCGLRWNYTPPAVHVDSWPVTGADEAAPYTTVSTWWADWEVMDGETYSNEKRTSFIDYLDLPAHVALPLELALCMSQSDEEQRDREMLRGKGWSVQDPWQICATPSDYRNYVQRSRGEFSCAKPSCMRLGNAWISDRTLCFLASGKPAIVQHTGASCILPDDEGLFRFRNLKEAIQAFEKAEADYERHGRLARSLVEERFDAKRVVAQLLEKVVS